MRRAILELQVGPDVSNLIQKSLGPELQREDIQTRIDISVDGSKLRLVVESPELSNLRAALNSYIRWINCIYSINEVISEH